LVELRLIRARIGADRDYRAGIGAAHYPVPGLPPGEAARL